MSAHVRAGSVGSRRPRQEGDPAGTVAAFLGAAAKRELDLFRRQADDVVESTDPEDVHRLRVARRRLQVALDGLSEVQPEGVSGALKHLNGASRSFGRVRDLDVQADLLDKEVARLPKRLRKAADRLLKVLNVRRNRARAALARKLSAGLLGPVTSAIEDALRISNVTPVDDALTPPDEFAARAVLRRLQSARQACGQLEPKVRPESFHVARIRVKKLRYAVELFAPLLPGGFGRLASQASSLQAVLGKRQDLAVMKATVAKAVAARRLSADPAVGEAAARLSAAGDKRAANLERKAVRDYRGFDDQDWARLQRRLRERLGQGS